MNKKLIVVFMLVSITFILSSCGNDVEIEVNKIGYFDRELLNIENEEINTSEESYEMYEAIIESFSSSEITHLYEESYRDDLEDIEIDGAVMKEDYFTINAFEEFGYRGTELVFNGLSLLGHYLSIDKFSNFTEESSFIQDEIEYTIFINDDSIYFEEFSEDENEYSYKKYILKFLENGHYVFEMYSEDYGTDYREETFLSSSSENGFVYLNVTEYNDTIGYTFYDSNFNDKTYHYTLLNNYNNESKFIIYRNTDLNTGIEYGFFHYEYNSEIIRRQNLAFINDKYEYIFSRSTETINDAEGTETNDFALIALDGWDYFIDDVLYSNDIRIGSVILGYEQTHSISIEHALTEELFLNPLTYLSFSGAEYEDIEEVTQLILDTELLYGYNEGNPIINGIEYTDFNLLFEVIFADIPDEYK